MYLAQKQLKTDTKILLTVTASLIIIGLLFIYSSSSVFALERHSSGHYFVKKQLIGFFLGLVGMLILRILPLDYLQRMSPMLFIGSLGFTALTLIPTLSHRIHGSSRWLNIGGFSFQPSELLKITFIMYLAYFLAKKEKQPYSFTSTYLPLLFIIGIPSLLLLKQPDFGMAITLISTALIMFFVMHFQLRHLLISIAALLPAIGILIYIKPYRWQRIMTFLNPWQDPQGAGFQIIQSLIAIGSGSFWGIGVGHSKQKFFYLPMQHTDFIFSIIAEETGFIGVTLLVTLFVLFLYFGIRLALQLKDMFCSLLVLGFILLISLQTVMNLAVVTGLVPTKGVGLPFISYGMSALLCTMCMMGLILNCVRSPQR